MDAIALGCLTALLTARRQLSRRVLYLFGGLGSLLMIFILGFSIRAEAWGLGRSGLDMTILAVGACMFIAAVAQTNWKSPRILHPLLKLGQRSYEIYLTHMFVVFGIFSVFVIAGKPMRDVPVLSIAVIIVSALLGELVARFYSEPMNHWLRTRWGAGAKKLGSVIEPSVPIENVAV
jgi:peptidoglycan/LPS O-acetylase OafA/YrhL